VVAIVLNLLLPHEKADAEDLHEEQEIVEDILEHSK